MAVSLAVRERNRTVARAPPKPIDRDVKWGPPPPARFKDAAGNEYETGAELGKGAFAKCYSARVIRDAGAQTVALKVIKTSVPPKVQEKLLIELGVHSKLRHPHIIQFHRAFSYDRDSLTIVLENACNGTLKQMVDRRGTLTLPEIRRFTLQLAAALTYLHRRDVIHRDIKLANLLLDADMNVKVADFGLTALCLTRGEFEEFRRTTMLGTPNYMAPELYDKTKGHLYPVDLFALGVVIYIMLVGKPPFQRKGDVRHDQIKERALQDDWDWPTDRRIPPDARDLVEQLMATREEDRPLAEAVPMNSFLQGDIPASLTSQSLSRPPPWSGSGRGPCTLIDRESFLKQCGFEVGPTPRIKGLLKDDIKLGRQAKLPLEVVYEAHSLPSPPSFDTFTHTSLLTHLTGQGAAVALPTARDCPPRIVSFVDKLPRYGFAWITADGSIGIFSIKGPTPCCLVIQDSARHWKKLNGAKLPLDQIDLLLEKDFTLHSWRRDHTSKMNMYSSFKPSLKLDAEKQSLIGLWFKFLDYFLKKLKSSHPIFNPKPSNTIPPLQQSSSTPPPPLPLPQALIGYQKHGNVGIALWSDSRLYATFPDSTELHLGTFHCAFRHLEPSIARRLLNNTLSGAPSVARPPSRTTNSKSSIPTGTSFGSISSLNNLSGATLVNGASTVNHSTMPPPASSSSITTMSNSSSSRLPLDSVSSMPLPPLRTLTLPLSTLLSASEDDNYPVWEACDAGLFADKCTFVADVLRVWKREGGPDAYTSRLRWTGPVWPGLAGGGVAIGSATGTIGVGGGGGTRGGGGNGMVWERFML